MAWKKSIFLFVGREMAFFLMMWGKVLIERAHYLKNNDLFP